MLADRFTKALECPKFLKMVEELRVTPEQGGVLREHVPVTLLR